MKPVDAAFAIGTDLRSFFDFSARAICLSRIRSPPPAIMQPATSVMSGCRLRTVRQPRADRPGGAVPPILVTVISAHILGGEGKQTPTPGSARLVHDINCGLGSFGARHCARRRWRTIHHVRPITIGGSRRVALTVMADAHCDFHVTANRLLVRNHLPVREAERHELIAFSILKSAPVSPSVRRMGDTTNNERGATSFESSIACSSRSASRSLSKPDVPTPQKPRRTLHEARKGPR